MKPLNIILFGKPGSGKGTQAKILTEKYYLRFIGTGDLLRDFIKRDLPAARRLREIVAKGHLAPSWLAFSLWLRELEKAKEDQGVIFDGSPRKLYEAKLLDEVLEWHGRQITTFLIVISDAEATKRLLLRGRHDDNEAVIRERLSWFPTEVMPVVMHYEKKGVLIRINGEQSVEAVHREILRHLPPSDEK